MNVVVAYKDQNYHIFWLSNRNKEGGFSGNLNIPHTNKHVKTWHFTYPSNGRFHYTIEKKDETRISFYQDQIVIKKEEKIQRFQGERKKEVIKRLAYMDLVPFGAEGDKPTLFEIINLGRIFLITNFFINTNTIHLFPVFKRELQETDLFFDINTYKNGNIVLEVFMSKDGKSNSIGVKCLAELTVDRHIPILKARILRQKPID